MASTTIRILYIFMLTLEFELLAKQFLFCSADERLDNVPNLAPSQPMGSNDASAYLYDESMNEDGVEAKRAALVEKKANSIKEAIKREIEKIGMEAEPSTSSREFYEAVQAQRAAMDAYARTNRKRKRALALSQTDESDSSLSGVAVNVPALDSQLSEGNIEEKRELPPYLFDSFQKARGALNGRQRSKRYDHEHEHAGLKKDAVDDDDSEITKDIDDE